MDSLDRLTWAACDWLASRSTFLAIATSFIAAVVLMVGAMEGPY